MSMLDLSLGSTALGAGYGGIANRAMQQYSNIGGLANNAFMDYLGKFGDYATQGLDFLDEYHKPIGTLGGLYSAWNQQDMSNKMYKAQKEAFNYNKMLNERENDRLRKRDDAFNSAWGA